MRIPPFVRSFASSAVLILVSSTAYSQPITPLSYRVTDAEYSKSLDRIVAVSSIPSNQLHIYDPVSEQEAVVELPLAPTSVSVGPHGLYAAVGHDAWVSYINLTTATLSRTMPVTTDVVDVVLAGNGYVYAFPRIDQWERIRCIHIATGNETLHTGYSIRAGTLAKLHPGGEAIYGADTNSFPSDIEKYGIANGTAEYLYDSPYHGDFEMCGDLWLSEDGFRIFTRCGNVFWLSDIQNEDMTYGGSLSELELIWHLSQSAVVDQVAVIPDTPLYVEPRDTEVQIYDYQFLTINRSIALPSFQVDLDTYTGHGRFVFFNRSGSKLFVILQADETSGLFFDYGVTVFSLTDAPGSIGDRIWLDVNGNGEQNVGESGVSGVTVTLYAANLSGSDGVLVESTITDVDGYYLFQDLYPADYYVEIEPPLGLWFTRSDEGSDALDSDVDVTTGRTPVIQLDEDEDDMTWDAGLLPHVYVLDGFGGVHTGGGAQSIAPPPPYFGFDVAQDFELAPNGFYVLDGFGGVHAAGGAAALSIVTPYFGFQIARDMELAADGFYVLDGFGGVHAGGGAPVLSPGSTYFGFDIAKDLELASTGFYLLDGFGSVHAGGGATSLNPNTPYFGFDIARDLELSTTGFYVLDGLGGVHAGGGAPAMSPSTPYFGFDIARDLELVEGGFYVLDGYGGLHAGAESHALGVPPAYFGFDVARDFELK